MAVKLRLKRFGRLNHPTFRLCATDTRSPRDGRIIESLGYYLPLHKRDGEQVSLNADRVKYWLSVGAQPSPTAVMLMRRLGILVPTRKVKVRKNSKVKGGKFTPPRKRQVTQRKKNAAVAAAAKAEEAAKKAKS